MTISGDMIQTSARDLVYVLFRHKGKIALFFLLVLAAVTAFTYLVTELYRSEAKLLIRIGRESVSPDPSVPGPVLPVYQDREKEVNSELAILTSQSLAEQVVDAIGVEHLKSGGRAQGDLRIARRIGHAAKYAAEGILVRLDLIPELTPKEKAVRKLMKRLSVEAEKRTNIIDVRYDGAGPELAQQTLEALIRFYLERHIAAYSVQASPRFFEEQEKRLNEELAAHEQALDAYRSQRGIVTLEGQREHLLDQVTALKKDADENASLVSAARARVASLEKALNAIPRTLELSRVSGRANPAADALKQKLQDLRLQETDLAARYPDTHRPLIDLRQQVRQIESALSKEQETRTEITTGIDENHQSLQLSLDTERAQFEALRARQTTLEDSLEQAHQRLTALASQETEYVRLEREVELAE